MNGEQGLMRPSGVPELSGPWTSEALREAGPGRDPVYHSAGTDTLAVEAEPVHGLAERLVRDEHARVELELGELFSPFASGLGLCPVLQ